MLKRIITNLLLVALVVVGLDVLIGKALNVFYFGQSSGILHRTTYAMEQTEAAILTFGSSRANHHYVTDVFEDSLKLSFYNTGRDGNGIFYQTAVLKSVLKRYTPKVIICDVYGGFAYDENAYDRMSSLLPYYEGHEEIREIVEMRGPFEQIKHLSHTYPYNGKLLTIAVGNTEFNKNRKSDNKGYTALYGEWSLELDTIPNLQPRQLDSNKINCFGNFVDLAKASGADVFVVYSPIYQWCEKRSEIEICRNICQEAKVPFYDFSKDPLFLQNKSWFQDFTHLNHEGAKVFSSMLTQKIKASTRNSMQ